MCRLSVRYECGEIINGRRYACASDESEMSGCAINAHVDIILDMSV